MGKQWKKDGKAATAQKKGKEISKAAKEIQVAAKLGGPDPDMNARLRLAIQIAKEVSCPKDTIERAIKKGAGLLNDGSVIEEILYEGYGPHQVGILVECHTDNRVRTAPEIRNIFKKHEGNLGEMGSVAWNFDRVALVEALHSKVSDPEEEAIEAGANEVIPGEDGKYIFYGNPSDLESIRSALAQRGWEIKVAEFSYKPKTLTNLNEEQQKEVYELLKALDDHDDSYRVHATIE